jgi:hypothetical protein
MNLLELILYLDIVLQKCIAVALAWLPLQECIMHSHVIDVEVAVALPTIYVR